MQELIDSGRYKVTEVLRSHYGYEAALCCDVTVSSGEMCIVNQYGSMAYIRELLPLFYTMEKLHFSGLKSLLTDSGSFSAVFVYRQGQPFAEFCKRRRHDYETSLKLADSMLCNALEFDLADDRIAAAGLMEENAVVDVTAQKVYFNLLLDPDCTGTGPFRTKRLGEMLNSLFERDRYFPDEIGIYIDKLRSGGYTGCAAAYSAWREIQPAAEKTREAYLKESFFKSVFRRLRSRKKRK